MWRLGDDHIGNHMILQSVKCWYNAVNHTVNKVWVQRNRCVWDIAPPTEAII